MDRDKMSNLYKGPSIDASYQVSVHLAEGFQRVEDENVLTQVTDKEKGALVYQVLIHVLFIGNTLVWHLNLHSFMSYVVFFSSPCQRQCELLPSLGVRRPLIY
jgi:hypothetical protein